MKPNTIKPFEMIETHHDHVACDGGGGALGHPRIYLNIDASVGQIVCPYCSRTYVLKSSRSRKSH